MFVCPECGAALAAGGSCPTDGAPLQAIGEDVLLGSTIGAYRVARLLGIGGMGRVYKGVHPTIGSRVAIKVLSRECSDRRDLVDRFFAEAKAVNLIRHESIVNVLDLATLPDGRPYIIMEYLDGAPLASIIEHAISTQTPLPLGGLARLAVEVLDALSAAHAKGIVHRDLKPDNIFVTPSGRPKVLDFGIAKLNDMTTGSATRTGSLLGTPHYMSPEQAAGKPVEHRADIYAMGVILFECVTGQKPFLAESLFELLRMHLETPPPSPRALRPELTVELEHVILTALGKSPEQRFGSAQAMSVALQHATAQLTPEQWTPITGSGTHRSVPSGAWQPTPPASWGGAPRGPRESVQPPNVQPPYSGHPSTVSASAGQLQKAPTAAHAPASNKGKWIALAAIALVGGGVAAAVVASNSGDSSGKAAAPPAGPLAANDPAPSDNVAPPAPPAPTEQADSPEPPAPTAKAAGTPAEDVTAHEDREDSDDEAIGDLTDMLAEVDLPPDVRKQIESIKIDGLAIDDLKQISKLPAAKRMAKLQELQHKLAKKSAPASTDLAEKPPGGALWDGDFGLAPFRLDAKRVDVSAFIKWAVAQARKADPDAVLIRIDVNNVAPDGTANLELPSLASSHGSIDLRFVSPSRAKPDPKLPIGVSRRDKVACEFRIEAEPGSVQIRVISPAITAAASCARQVAVSAPRCSTTALWRLAVDGGAPATNAVANLGYRARGAKGVWFFDIGDPGDKLFSNVFPDGC